jgi:hypothetical protein
MWAVVTALSLMVAAPVIASLSGYFGHSRLATGLTLEFDPAAAIEWIRHGRDEVPVFVMASAAAALCVMAVASAFLSGGALGQLAFRSGFWAGGGKYFWRLLRLSVLAGIFYMTAISLAGVALNWVDTWFADSMVERPVALAKRSLEGFALLAVWVIASAFDYAKVRIVVDGTRSVSVAGFAGVGFVLRNPWRSLSPLAFIGLCGMVIFAFYQTAYNVFDFRGLRTIVISILGQQLYVVLRLWLRLWQWSACLQTDMVVRRPASPWAISEPEPHGDNI